MRRVAIAIFLPVFLLTAIIVLAPPSIASADIEVTCEGGDTTRVADNASADEIAAACNSDCSRSGSFLGFPTWYKYLEFGTDSGTGDPCAIIGPRHSNTREIDMAKAAGYVAIAVVEILLRIAAIVAVGFVMYGGFRYITSQGEPENTKSARQMIINSLIGLVIALIATGLVTFIANTLTR